MRNHFSLSLINGLILAALSGFAFSTQAGSPEQIIRNNCVGCHVPESDDSFSRISYQRRTPEGWEMTIARMQLMHHVRISDQEIPITDEVIHKLVKYFADRQGLAPSETEGYRYILERRLNVVEQHDDEEFAVMCARCHSGARVALQRRTEKEWEHLVHFHLGQFPTSEYSAGGRDRNWLEVALNNTVPYLTKHYPLDTEAWDKWQNQAKPELQGRWRLIGNQPGKGDFEGIMTVTEDQQDTFNLTFKGRYQNGELMEGAGAAVVYTGFEWRASISIGDQTYNQVMAATESGEQLKGRMFLRDHEEIGVQLHGVKMSEKPVLMAAFPGHIKAGTRSRITLIGTALSGEIQLGQCLKVERVISLGSEEIQLDVTAPEDCDPGKRSLQVGNSELADGLVVYDRISNIAVNPPYAVARVGENGGATRKTFAAFQALALGPGPDGQAGTEDDLRIGYMPAEWSVAPFDAKAEQDQDVRFAGRIDKNTGVFTPALAGPNPKRKYSTNNAGNLAVIAKIKTGDSSLEGQGHLLVTVQRWNNPPIR